MVVLITNVTDGPDMKPREVRVYNQVLLPGQQIRVDPRYVDKKVRKLEIGKFIAIGKVPPWYADYTAKRKKRNLTAAQVTAAAQASKDYHETRAARKAANVKKTSKASKAPATLDLADPVSPPTDKVSVSTKESKKDKRNRR